MVILFGEMRELLSLSWLLDELMRYLPFSDEQKKVFLIMTRTQHI